MRCALTILLVLLPGSVIAAETPSFLNDVEPLLTRMGCNQGACHGKGAGQNGFRLSLRGYAPEWDHGWLTREFASRRVHLAFPEESLLLLKPLGVAPHEGGKLFDKGSREYTALLEWIRAGAPGPNANDPTLVSVKMQPNTKRLKPGQDVQLRMEATFSDGLSRDVTWLAKFEVNDPSVASVTADGVARMVRTGETAVRGAYLGQVAIAVLTAPHDAAIDKKRFAQENNFIDHHVMKKLADLSIEPSNLCDDAAFLRRLYLDTIGVLPTADEVRAFLADTNSNKRALAIDRVLDRPEFVDFWTWWLCDLLQNRKESDHDVRGAKGVRAFHDWVRKQVAMNRPWDELTRDVLTANGNVSENPAVGYYIVTVGEQREAHKSSVVASAAQTFLGSRIGCAQCHNHPAEKYTQDDYYHFAAYFSRIKFSRKDPKMGDTLLAVGTQNPKDVTRPVGVNQPRTGKFLPPRPLDRRETAVKPEDDPRKVLADWITDPANEYFAGAMVNRLWAHFLGTGLVEPIDDLRASNPPSNPELWKALVAEFTKSKFDRKQLMRLILNSRTYQLASETRIGNEKDQRFYSHYQARRLSAEVLLDALSQATGVPENFEGYPQGLRALQIPDPGAKSYFLSIFGRSERLTACACERNGEVTLPQMLHLYGSSPIEPKITNASGRLAGWLKSKKSDSEIVEEIFLTALGRQPRASEMQQITQQLAAAEGDSRETIFRDLFWAVLNSSAFGFNH